MTPNDGSAATPSRVLLIFIAAISAAVLIAPAASAQFACTTRDSACVGDETEIFSMSSTSNAHAEIASMANYNYRVCCGGMGAGIIGTSCNAARSAVAFNLSSVTNAHVANPLIASPAYSTGVCLSTTVGRPFCSIAGGTCPQDYVCLATISSLTNAHVGDCNAYSLRLCCALNRPPWITDIQPPPGDSRGYITFNASTGDLDGDPIDQVEFRVTFSGGSRNLGIDTASPWQATWNSYADVGAVIQQNVTIFARAYDGAYWGPWRSENFTVNNTRPSASITGPPNASRTGRIFNASWVANNVFTNWFDVEYVDPALYIAGSGWIRVATNTSLPYMQMNLSTAVHGTQYCFRVRGVEAVDGIGGDWSCNPPAAVNPANYGCTCVRMETAAPSASIDTSPRYTNVGTFNVNWTGYDADSGISCYAIEYMLYNETSGAQILNWRTWTSVNNAARLTYDGGSCVLRSCTTSVAGVFNRATDLPGALVPQDGQTAVYRVTPIDAAYGCANAGIAAQSASITAYDRTPPPNVVTVARDADGMVMALPTDVLYTPDSVTFSMSAGPHSADYTGIRLVGTRYWLMKPGSGAIVGRLDGNALTCATNTTSCTIAAGPWYDDYNVSFLAYAWDWAGNLNETGRRSFLVLKPMKLEADVDNVYMTLGSENAVTLTVSNRQVITDNISVVITGYPYARFTEESEGEMGTDSRSINVTLSPKESKTLHVIVTTSEIGDAYKFTVTANTTRAGLESKVEDYVDLDVRIVYPHEFPAPGVEVLFIAAMASVVAYAALSRFGARKLSSSRR